MGFSLVLVSVAQAQGHLLPANVRQVLEVSPEQARDSWFVGYEWSIVICRRGSGRHLGWKFTPRGHTNEAPFYALIVAASEVEAGMRGQVTSPNAAQSVC